MVGSGQSLDFWGGFLLTLQHDNTNEKWKDLRRLERREYKKRYHGDRLVLIKVQLRGKKRKKKKYSKIISK